MPLEGFQFLMSNVGTGRIPEGVRSWKARPFWQIISCARFHDCLIDWATAVDSADHE
jgi:hypothetical protein